MAAFNRVFVTVGPTAGKLVEWRLSPYYQQEAVTLQFYVEVARTTGEWERLNADAPIENLCYYTDTTGYRYNVSNDIYYRVVMMDGTTEHVSAPAGTMGALNRHDWLIAKEVLRKEYLRMKKGPGIAGYLLIRREHGEVCTACTDWDTEEVVNTLCTECFGTGKVHGYYNAYYPYYMSAISGPSSQKDVVAPFGTEDTKVVQRRAIAYPRLEPYSLWVAGDTDKRYVIRRVTIDSGMRSLPLIYSVEMREIPMTGIEYQVPMEQTVEGGPAEGDESGWRLGIGELD